jgi:thiamine pyrophosphate-dependent acetolactate synthase large subunit-like protein
MVGLGLALAQPKRRVLVVTGDGEMLMGLGALATIAVAAPANLAIAVIDNERYGETGMQETHTGHGVDLAGMARAAGFRDSRTVATAAEVETLVPALLGAAGPVFADIKVSPERPPMILPPRDGTFLKHRFRISVLGAAAAGA